MRWICSPMQGVEFPDASQKGIVRLRVKFSIITEIRLIENQIFLVRFVASPIPPINVGITLITRGWHLVQNLIPSIGEIIQIGVRIGSVVELNSVVPA